MEKEETIKIYENQPLSIADFSNRARFIIIEGSTSAHCCFKYTVIDTKEGKRSYGDYWKRQMCETFEKEEAIEICTALNKYYC